MKLANSAASVILPHLPPLIYNNENWNCHYNIAYATSVNKRKKESIANMAVTVKCQLSPIQLQKSLFMNLLLKKFTSMPKW